MLTAIQAVWGICKTFTQHHDMHFMQLGLLVCRYISIRKYNYYILQWYYILNIRTCGYLNY